MAFLPQGPDENELSEIIDASNSAPDHGGLMPWRILVVTQGRRDFLYQSLVKTIDEDGEFKIKRLKSLCFKSPVILIGIFSPNLSSKVPRDEQIITAGRPC